jgi:hypothetical protein
MYQHSFIWQRRHYMFRPLQGHHQVNLQKRDLSHSILFVIWIHIITIFYHLFSENTHLLKYNLTNIQFFKIKLKN